MALVKNVMVLFFFLALIEVSFGVVYEVGDSRGWTNDSSIDYKSWASTKEFRVGDTIRFVYNPIENNVMLVTYENFKSCNSTDPKFVRISGNDSLPITKPGHYYYICGVPGHCEVGQKVDIRVPKTSSPSPSLSPSPTEGHAPAPGPSKSSASSNQYFKHLLAFQLFIATGVLACFAF
ncbi:mavicyanin [Quercus suber]|uniref:Mavicyanin n=1 Tax=Quercus suber TaxID=58331 RepID=A0AAW0M1U1_QUESU|nr:mavicyanin-like [Quercus suber]